MEIHVVSKIDNKQHATISLQTPSSPTVKLPPSSIRVHTLLISLTSNNLTYARGGHVLHWWDTYPVPSSSPAPYNDSSSWGIVPAWGYAVVVESTTSIQRGTLMRGFWPTSTVPTELKLRAAESKGQWMEISDRRQKLLHAYNRYIEIPGPAISLSPTGFEDYELENLAWNALFRSVWEAAYLLSQYVFSPSPQIQSPIHPWGGEDSWTAADADLSCAVLVSLSASCKTARSFTYHLSRKPASAGPLAFLQVTSSPSAISEAAEKLQLPYPTRAVAYSEIPESSNWMASYGAAKIVIVDFGARTSALDQLLEAIKTHSVLRSSKVVIIQVGYQQKVYTYKELMAVKEAASRLSMVPYNASGVQNKAVQLKGVEAYSNTLSLLWDQWLRDRHYSIPDMRLVWGKGVSGSGGIEGGWERLCQGRVGPEEGLMYLI